MIRNSVKASLLKRQKQTNDWNEQIEFWKTEEEPIEVMISVATGSAEVMNSVLSIKSTHIGLTKDKRPKEGDKIQVDNTTYVIDYVIPTHRMTQLMLTSEAALE